MDVTSTNQMQQMQIRKMNGSLGSHGQGGMRDIMQNLSTDDKNSLIEQLSSMDKEQRMESVSQMKEIDASAMNMEEYTKAIFAILDKKNINETQNEGFSAYA